MFSNSNFGKINANIRAGWFGQARSQNPFMTGIRAVRSGRDTLCQTTKNHETTRKTLMPAAGSRFVSFVSSVVSWYESLQKCPALSCQN